MNSKSIKGHLAGGSKENASLNQVPTPLTDAFMLRHDYESVCHTRKDLPAVSRFCRQLERELAAAPELLAALELLCNACLDGAGGTARPSIGEVSDARAAIAKAKGAL